MCKLLLAGLIVASCSMCRSSDVQLEVYISGITPLVDAQTLMRGQLKAVELLKHNGVAVQWFRGKPKSCLGGNEQVRLIVEIISEAPKTVSADALAGTEAVACPATTIQLYWDRVMRLMRNLSVSDRGILGFVLAHELVHALSESPHHEKDGFMKSKWTADDVRGMAFGEGDLVENVEQSAK